MKRASELLGGPWDGLLVYLDGSPSRGYNITWPERHDGPPICSVTLSGERGDDLLVSGNTAAHIYQFYQMHHERAVAIYRWTKKR